MRHVACAIYEIEAVPPNSCTSTTTFSDLSRMRDLCLVHVLTWVQDDTLLMHLLHT